MEGALIIFGTTMAIWFVFCVIRPISYVKWVLWKRAARLAIANHQTARCWMCHEHIFPGQQVVNTKGKNTPPGEFLVHIAIPSTMFSHGGQFSLKSRYTECALLIDDQKNLGTWDGFQFVPDSRSTQVQPT